MQKDFASWFVDLDSHYARVFVEHVMKEDYEKWRKINLGG